METKMYESITRTVSKPINSPHISEVYLHKEYTLLSYIDPDDLAKHVTEHLNEGWKLYGSPFAEADNYEWHHYQAMTRGI